MQQLQVVKEETGIGSSLIYQFLSERLTPEEVLLYVRASDFLRGVNLLEDVENDVEVFITTLGSSLVTEDNILDHIRDAYLTEVREFISSTEVTTSNELRFEEYIDIAEALNSLEFYEDSELILTILDGEDSNETLLADLLKITGSFDFAHYITSIYSCSTALLTRIGELHTISGEMVQDDQDLEKARMFQKRLRAFAKFLGTTNLRVINMVRSGMAYGLPLESYLTRLNEILCSLEPENVGVELVALSIICEEYEQNAMQLIDPFIELLSDDTERTSRIRNTVLNVLKRAPNLNASV